MLWSLKVLWNRSEIALKVLWKCADSWKCSESALKVLWKCSECSWMWFEWWQVKVFKLNCWFQVNDWIDLLIWLEFDDDEWQVMGKREILRRSVQDRLVRPSGFRNSAGPTSTSGSYPICSDPSKPTCTRGASMTFSVHVMTIFSRIHFNLMIILIIHLYLMIKLIIHLYLMIYLAINLYLMMNLIINLNVMINLNWIINLVMNLMINLNLMTYLMINLN